MQTTRRAAALLPALSLALLSLSGCKMIDQTLFRPDPEPGEEAAPPPAATSARPASQAPVLSIRYDTPNPSYKDALAQAVRAVEQRRPGAVYDVVAASSAAEAPQAAKDAGGVMAAMKELGVPNNRLNLGARLEPGLTTREVRLYLR
jgi:hypothetical protein